MSHKEGVSWVKLFIVFCISYALFSSWLGVSKSREKLISSQSSNQSQAKPSKALPNFTWGVGFNPYPTYVEIDQALEDNLELADELGVSMLRMRFPRADERSDRLTYFDKIITASSKHHKNIYLMLEEQKDDIAASDRYNLGFKYAYDAAKYYKGRVSVYQLGNEAAVYALRPGWGGKVIGDYDEVKYANLVSYLKGMSDGIKAGDPDALRIVTGHHTHYGFWQAAQSDGLDFDIVGWDWFHNEAPVPDFFAYDIDGVPTDMTTVLSKLGKPIWITEAGVPSGRVGDQVAADHLKLFAVKAFRSGKVKGFFPIMLTDQAHQVKDENYKSGLVGLEQLGEWSFKFGEKRAAYEGYKQVIMGLK